MGQSRPDIHVKSCSELSWDACLQICLAWEVASFKSRFRPDQTKLQPEPITTQISRVQQGGSITHSSIYSTYLLTLTLFFGNSHFYCDRAHNKNDSFLPRGVNFTSSTIPIHFLSLCTAAQWQNNILYKSYGFGGKSPVSSCHSCCQDQQDKIQKK